MVTRFATAPPTDNCPQPKEAQPLSQLDIRLIQYIFTPRLCGLMARRWLLIGHFPVLYNPTGVAPVGLVGVVAGASVDSMGLLPPQQGAVQRLVFPSRYLEITFRLRAPF